MTEYLGRSFWADSDWRRGGAQMTDDDIHILGNVCHYPGRASAFGLLSLDELRSNLRGWWDFHVNVRGWSDLGYGTAICQRGRVVDLRGIGRVPAAHASASNPRANWHGGATLFVVGNTEEPSDALIEAYRHYRHNVWLERWPAATGITGHGRVPGAQTSCPGREVLELVDSGSLRRPPGEEDDLKDDEREALFDLHKALANSNGAQVRFPDGDYHSARSAVQSILHDTYNLDYRVWSRRGTLDYVNPENPASKAHQLSRGHQYSLESLKIDRRNEDRLKALMAAVEGIDQDGIEALIHQSADEAAARDEEIVAKVDSLSEKADGMVSLLEDFESGAVDISAEELAQRLIAIKANMYSNAVEDGGEPE